MKKTFLAIAATLVFTAQLAQARSLAPNLKQLKFDAEVTFQQRWTLVPAVMCLPGQNCPKSQPYYVVTLRPLNMKTKVKIIDASRLSRSTIGVSSMPRTLKLGNVWVKNGEVVRIDGTVRIRGSRVNLEKINRIKVLSKPQNNGRNLGAGYVCLLQNSSRPLTKQIKVYLYGLKSFNRGPVVGATQYMANMIVDDALMFPTRTLLKTTAKMTSIMNRLRTMKVKSVDGKIAFSFNQNLGGDRMPAKGQLKTSSGLSSLSGSCVQKAKIVRDIMRY